MAARSDLRRAAPPQGINPVLLTPFTAGGAVDEAGFLRTVDHVLSRGAGSVMFPGFATPQEDQLTAGKEMNCPRTGKSNVRPQGDPDVP